MAKADLHAHSKYSGHASEWFLKKLGAPESFTEPEEVFRLARERGMDFFTLTDHNSIDGAISLKAKYPRQAFTGLEATAYFPEDGCKLHLLVYGLVRNQFLEIDRLRTNVYKLRDYLKQERLPYSVAHATFAVNDRLRPEHLEKLILLFDVFEGINGSRDQALNQGWMDFLRQLTPGHVDELRRKHGIEPISEDPWVKGFTGGSDDHAGLFIGRTFTQADASTPEEFLEQIRNKHSRACGRQNNFRVFTFTIYKIAYEFARSHNAALTQSWLGQLTDFIFQNKALKLKTRWWLRSVKGSRNGFHTAFRDLVGRLSRMQELDVEDKLSLVYDMLSRLVDDFVTTLLGTFSENLRSGQLLKLVQTISALLPAAFLAAPFFSSLRHLFKGRTQLGQLTGRYLPAPDSSAKRRLWFTDTLTDLNGVAETIQRTAKLALAQGWELQIAAIVSPGTNRRGLPSNLLELPACGSLPLPYYEKIQLGIPSVLAVLDQVYRQAPEEIIVSTPGPVGLMGLLVSKLLNIPCQGIFHTDFSAQALAITGDEDIRYAVERYMKWFYSSMQSIKVPTLTCKRELVERGYPSEKVMIYRKSIDTRLFQPNPEWGRNLRDTLDQPGHFTLLYAGRLSKDKDFDFLLAVYRELIQEIPALNLWIAGEGPEMSRGQQETAEFPGVRFLGRVPHAQMPGYYSAADLLVFPSRTDTFGMVVAEAQACGLPALVSDQGGPREIILPTETGMIAKANQAAAWILAIRKLHAIWEIHPSRYRQMREAAAAHAGSEYGGENLGDQLFFPPQDVIQPSKTGEPNRADVQAVTWCPEFDPALIQ